MHRDVIDNTALTDRIIATLDSLKLVYPDTRCLLNFSNMYELLIATMLSASTTDRQVNNITVNLFARANNPYDMMKMSYEEIVSIIRSGGNYNRKAQNVLAISRDIVMKYGGVVPCDKYQLMTMSGVGEKTANVVLSVGFGVPALAVDTHVFRVAGRLGHTNSPTNPIDATRQLENVVPRDRWIEYHKLIITHGRMCCGAMRPKCSECVISEYCDSYGRF